MTCFYYLPLQIIVIFKRLAYPKMHQQMYFYNFFRGLATIKICVKHKLFSMEAR